ncbi:MAG: hypothetical protein ABWY82_25625 [Tardiphaga sp.]
MSWLDVIVAILFAVMLLVAGADFLQITHSETRPETTACVPLGERERIRDVTLEGIDQGLKNHVTKLFDVWMKDDSNQPKRAIDGMSIGISAHVRARANAISWNPPPC